MYIEISIALGCLISFIEGSEDIVRFCVPKDKFEECQQMIKDTAAITPNIRCVQGNDRLDCIDKIAGPFIIYQMPPQADAMFAEPEDLLLAYQRSNSTFKAFIAVKTKEEPHAEFQYESVAVVPIDSPVKHLSDLRGLKSCHTGVGRNAGYKIPFTILTKANIMKADNDSTLSCRETELKAFSTFFSKSCIVGKWSSHSDADSILKNKYSNLCIMCEKPEQCDYPDSNSGYYGALRCLVDSNADVAFTKVIAVQKFFGLHSEGNPHPESCHYNATKYRYLCTDGTHRPLDGPACVWAARPWPVIITNNKVTSDDIFAKMKDDLLLISNFGQEKGASWSWRKDILGLDDHNHSIYRDIEPVTPLQYLKKARYYDVLTRRQEFGPFKTIRLCEVTLGFLTSGKCEKLSTSAFSRGIRPRIECINEDSVVKCLEAVKSSKADAFFVDPHDAYLGMKKYNLNPLIMEKYGNLSHQYLAVVVPKNSTINSLEDLEKNKRICWWTQKKSEYDTAIAAVIANGLMEKKCPLKYFSSLGSQASPTCLTSPVVTFHENPVFDDVMLRPMTPTLGRDFDHYHPSDTFELLCPLSDGNAKRMPFDNVENCNFGVIPPRMMLVKSTLNELEKDELITLFTNIGEVYNENPDYFRFFGDFNSLPDVLVSNAATGFTSMKFEIPFWEEYKKIRTLIESCE